MEKSAEGIEVNAAYIRAGRALLIMLVIGLVVAAFIRYGIQGYIIGPNFWWGGLPRILGQAIGLTTASALVVAPWRFIQRRRGNITDAPILVGGILFLIFAASAVNVALFEKSLMN